jgi:uncharacterized coiled-coil DUF342 family protein
VENSANVHSDRLALAVRDLHADLIDIRDECANLHEESGNSRAAIEELAGEVRMVRKVLEEVREALTPLHYLARLSDHLERLVREGG